MTKLLDNMINGTKLTDLPTVKDFKETLENRNDHIELINTSMFRDLYTEYSWAAITQELINGIIKYIKDNKIKRVYVLGCGNGFLTKWLQIAAKKMDVKFIAIDNGSDKREHKLDFVENMDASLAINDCKEGDLIILCWPREDLANSIAKQIKPNIPIIYIGEDEGGCCAGDPFFFDLYVNTININHYTFPFLYDKVYIAIKE